MTSFASIEREAMTDRMHRNGENTVSKAASSGVIVVTLVILAVIAAGIITAAVYSAQANRDAQQFENGVQADTAYCQTVAC